jgi:hypothetical protein
MPGNIAEALHAVPVISRPSSREVIVRYWRDAPTVHRPDACRWALPAIYGHCAEPGSRRLDVRFAPISRLSTDDDASASLIKADGT